MSTLSWIDFSEKDRRRMLDVVALFQEHETRDELGLGSIRDAIAELLFPGTSTIQTRARYFLFVPWIYLNRERLRTPSSRIAEYARWEEIALIDSLIKGGESEGVIGIEARRNLQRLPSSIYWYGLGRWGIRRFNGSLLPYHRSLDHFYKYSGSVSFDDNQEPLLGEIPRNWDPELPDRPPDLLNETKLSLSNEEAIYLSERILFFCKESMLAHLIDRSTAVGRKVEFIWLHPDRGGFPKRLEEIVENARRFSEIMHGAALLYDLMLAEKGRYDDWKDEYDVRLGEWAVDIEGQRGLFQSWDLPRFWDLVTTHGARIGPLTHHFVTERINLVFFVSAFLFYLSLAGFVKKC